MLIIRESEIKRGSGEKLNIFNSYVRLSSHIKLSLLNFIISVSYTQVSRSDWLSVKLWSLENSLSITQIF